MFIGNVEQCIGKKSSFGITHGHLSPFGDLKSGEFMHHNKLNKVKPDQVHTVSNCDN